MAACTNWARRQSGLLTVFGLVGLGLLLAQTIGARGPAGAHPAGELELKPVVELRLHGSTPSIAWAADGRRLAINATFGAYDSEQLTRRHRAELGVHVLDVQTGRTLRVPFVGARHPFWLDGDTLGWVNNYYVGKRAGLFLAGAHPGAEVRKLGQAQSAHRAHLGRDGRIVV